MPDVFLVNSHEQERLHISEAIKSYPTARIVNEARTGQEAILLMGTTRAGVIICRSSLPDMSGLEVVEKIQQSYPQIQIILTLVGNEPTETWQKILELGIRNVITPPLDVHSVHRALSLAQQNTQKNSTAHMPHASRDSYIISVAGARGGVGKSLVATNIAHLLAQWSDSVLLLDYTGRPNDFSVMLDHVPRNTLADLLSSGDAVDTEFLQSLLTIHPGGFRYLPSPPQEFDSAEFTRPLARELLQYCRQLADYIIVDTNEPHFSVTQPALMESDLILLVTTRDVIRLLSSQRYLQLMKEWDIDLAKVKILVNFAEVGVEIADSEIESILEHPVAAYLPSNPESATYSINSGKAICIHDPKQPLAVVLTKIAELCWARWETTAAKPTEKPGSRGTTRLKSFFLKR